MQRTTRAGAHPFSAYAYVLPATLLFVVFVAYPIVWVVQESLFGLDQARASSFIGVGNYLRAVEDPSFWTVVRNMLLWGAITIPVQMVVGGLIAYAIETYTSLSKPFFRTMFFLPVVTSVSVVAIVWVQIYAPYYGIAQEYLGYLGIDLNFSVIGDGSTAIYALIVVNIWQWTGFSMLMYIAGLHNIPGELIDAARIDGAGGWAMATKIYVPLLAPVTKSLLMLGIIGTLQTFPIVHLMTGGGPNHASEIFGTYIFQQGFVIGNTGYASALSVIVLVIALVLSVIQIVAFGTRFAATRRAEA